MNTIDQLRFTINDRIDNIDVSPSHVSLALLAEFQKDVGEFLKGSNNDIDPTNVLVSIEAGSFTILASGLLIANTLWTDLEHLKSTNSLSSIDSKRARVIERWQTKAQKNPNRRYSVVNQSAEISVWVDSTSDFRKTEDMWVHVEKYLHGKIVDIGGKNKANVHLELEDGTSLIIAAAQVLLEQEEQNRLYRSALLHVTAEENLITGELRNYQLLSFPDYHPSYNDDEFNLMVERGTKAWIDVPDATAWLENLRGNPI
jgi:hypothetical protein